MNKIPTKSTENRLNTAIKRIKQEHTKKVNKMFTPRGLYPQLHILDNECSSLFKYFMIKIDEILSLCLHIYINETQLKGQFRHLRITLLLGLPVLTNISPCIFGAN